MPANTAAPNIATLRKRIELPPQ